MQMIKYNKIIKLLLLFSIIVCGNLNCIPTPSFPLQIKNDIIESNKQLVGRIGFCSIVSDSNQEEVPPFWHFTKTEWRVRGIYYKIDELQNLFLDIIGNRELVDCNYKKLKDFNYRKSRPIYFDFLAETYFSQPKGYIEIFDRKDEDGNWVMYKEGLRFLNDFFNCDYYLTGKVYLSYEKKSGYDHNLLLVIYNHEGYKVWSKRYKNKYLFDDKLKGNAMIEETYYKNIKTLLNDYKDEINKDLDMILGSRKN